jgi:DNA mismatch endonuclease (patch repair protein)
MTDIFTKEKRSWVMSRIRGKNTRIEIMTGRLLSSKKIKFKRHPKIYGNPDFLVGKKTAVFCDGDFWHGFQYDEKKKPKKEFWKNKIEENMKRDRRISRKLRRDGYSVIRLWEHDIEKRPNVCLSRIIRFMR